LLAPSPASGADVASCRCWLVVGRFAVTHRDSRVEAWNRRSLNRLGGSRSNTSFRILFELRFRLKR